jgi:3-hydroxyacyl-[acyl-carrier-protein] dehydratase
MRFCLLDRITDLERGSKITAVKLLRPEEDYLRDHFPRFPVMPGVLMLEAMFQASAWLVRDAEDFQHAAIVLKEARNVKYSDFVTPGKQLIVTAEILKQDATTTTLKTQGTVDGNPAVAARLILEKFNVGDRFPVRTNCDPYIRKWMRNVFDRLLTSEGYVAPPPGMPMPHFSVKAQRVSAQT